MMSVNIIHVMWNMDIGGAERAVYQLIREQRRTGIESDIILLNKKGLYGKLCEEAGADVYFLKMKRAYDRSVTKKFPEILNNYDIVHFHSAEPYPIYLSTLNRNIKKFYTHRGGVYPYSFLKSLRYKYCGSLFRKHFSGISGNTSEGVRAASLLFKIPLKNISVTYNGLDFSLLEPSRSKRDVMSELGLSGSELIIGTSANFKRWKRIEYLIKILPLIKDTGIKILLLGDGPETANLKNLAKEKGVDEKVIFAGKKTHITDYLQVIDIFILPSESLESFGNSAVEAMASGIPTIVMEDGGGLSEHILNKETGFIASDFNDLVKITNELIGNPELRNSIGNASKSYIRNKYSLKNMMYGYNKFYNIQPDEAIPD